MTIVLGQRKGVRVLECSGRLTLGDGAANLRRHFDTCLDLGDRRLLIDLGHLEYMDSAGIGEIVACYKHASERAAVVKVVVPPTGAVRRVFDIAGLDRALENYSDAGTAASSFA